MANDGTGLAGTQLEVFELQARALSSRSARWESSARDLVEALQSAAKGSERTVRVPLYGEARQQMLRPLKIVLGGETITLPARYRWTVIGQPREELKSLERPPSPAPIAQPTPSPPRTGPSVPRPEPTTGMKRLPKQPGGPVEDVTASSRANAASAPDSKDAKPKAETKAANAEAAPALREEANGQEPVRKEPAEEAPRDAEKAKPSAEVASARDGAKQEKAAPDERKEPAADAKRKQAKPSRAPAHGTRRSAPRAIVILLVLATVVAVYVRWHEDILRFVSQYIHPG
jgi:hypothetical protein